MEATAAVETPHKRKRDEKARARDKLYRERPEVRVKRLLWFRARARERLERKIAEISTYPENIRLARGRTPAEQVAFLKQKLARYD